MTRCLLTLVSLSLAVLFLTPPITPATAKDPPAAPPGALAATVRIRSAADQKAGSGAIVGHAPPFMYVLTALHVVEQTDSPQIDLFSRDAVVTQSYRNCSVVARSDKLSDLALVRVPVADHPGAMLRIAPSGDTPANRTISVLALGCDRGLAPTAVADRAILKKVARERGVSETAFFWQVERRHATGRSGGPLLDDRGYLIGVCSATSGEHTYFAHVSEIQRFLAMNGFRWLFDAPGKTSATFKRDSISP